MIVRWNALAQMEEVYGIFYGVWWPKTSDLMEKMQLGKHSVAQFIPPQIAKTSMKDICLNLGFAPNFNKIKFHTLLSD